MGLMTSRPRVTPPTMVPRTPASEAGTASSPRPSTTLVQITASSWREAHAAAIHSGGRFAGLYAVGPDDTTGNNPANRDRTGTTIRSVFAFGDQVKVLSARAVPTQAVEMRRAGTSVAGTSGIGRTLPSIVDILPAAAWDEREAHDLYEVDFPGHVPMRPLISHSDDLGSWTVPVVGAGTHQVAVGPIHAGVIESGHFRFHVVGERVLHLDLRLFYNHRGLERAAVGAPLDTGLAIIQRACGACAVSNTLAFTQACEEVLGLWPDAALSTQRTILVELERLYNHLNDIGAMCAGIGFAPGTMAFAALKERAQRLIGRLAGHRFMFGTVHIAKGAFSPTRGETREARLELLSIKEQSARSWREVLFNTSVQNRVTAVGILDHASAERFGAVGPAARASGIPLDTRSHSPRLDYGELQPPSPVDPTGDVAARMAVRAAELETTLALLDALLARDLHDAAAGAITEGSPIGVGVVESPRGATTCIVESDGTTIQRLHLRTASYANWPAVAHATAGNLLPDFPLVNKSFELCYACSDR